MGYADKTIYKKNKDGKYVFSEKKTYYDVPLTYGRWKESQKHDKSDRFKTRIYVKKSRSGLSLVPKKVVYEDLDYGEKVVLTNFRANKPDKRKNKSNKCKRKNCPYRY